MNDTVRLEHRETGSYYLSPIQWSKIFALAWLDEDLRKDPKWGDSYRESVNDWLAQHECLSALSERAGEQAGFKDWVELDPKITVDSAQDFLDFMETNPVVQDALGKPEGSIAAIFDKNDLRYFRLVKMDPPPSALEGYSQELIRSVAAGETPALALPTAATCS